MTLLKKSTKGVRWDTHQTPYYALECAWTKWTRCGFHNLLNPSDDSREVIDDSARFCTEKVCIQIHRKVHEGPTDSPLVLPAHVLDGGAMFHGALQEDLAGDDIKRCPTYSDHHEGLLQRVTDLESRILLCWSIATLVFQVVFFHGTVLAKQSSNHGNSPPGTVPSITLQGWDSTPKMKKE